MKEMTDKQKQIQQILEEFEERHKRFPKIREIMDLSWMKSTTAVRDALEALTKKGVVRKSGNGWVLQKSEAMRLAEKIVEIADLGRVDEAILAARNFVKWNQWLMEPATEKTGEADEPIRTEKTDDVGGGQGSAGGNALEAVQRPEPLCNSRTDRFYLD